MVNHEMLTAEISFPSLQLDVRLNVELRDHLGRVGENWDTVEVSFAIVEALEVFCASHRYGFSKALAEIDAHVTDAQVEHVMTNATFSSYHASRYAGQLDLFAEADMLDGIMVVS